MKPLVAIIASAVAIGCAHHAKVDSGQQKVSAEQERWEKVAKDIQKQRGAEENREIARNQKAEALAARRDRIAAKTELGAKDIRRLIEISEEWWVEGDENARHGGVLLEIQGRHPDVFEQQMQKSKAKESASVLMDAVREGAQFTITPGVISLRGKRMTDGGLSIDLSDEDEVLPY